MRPDKGIALAASDRQQFDYETSSVLPLSLDAGLRPRGEPDRITRRFGKNIELVTPAMALHRHHPSGNRIGTANASEHRRVSPHVCAGRWFPSPAGFSFSYGEVGHFLNGNENSLGLATIIRDVRYMLLFLTCFEHHCAEATCGRSKKENAV